MGLGSYLGFCSMATGLPEHSKVAQQDGWAVLCTYSPLLSWEGTSSMSSRSLRGRNGLCWYTSIFSSKGFPFHIMPCVLDHPAPSACIVGHIYPSGPSLNPLSFIKPSVLPSKRNAGVPFPILLLWFIHSDLQDRIRILSSSFLYPSLFLNGKLLKRDMLSKIWFPS